LSSTAATVSIFCAAAIASFHAQRIARSSAYIELSIHLILLIGAQLLSNMDESSRHANWSSREPLLSPNASGRQASRIAKQMSSGKPPGACSMSGIAPSMKFWHSSAITPSADMRSQTIIALQSAASAFSRPTAFVSACAYSSFCRVQSRKPIGSVARLVWSGISAPAIAPAMTHCEAPLDAQVRKPRFFPARSPRVME
jgi:hypothetical protein